MKGETERKEIEGEWKREMEEKREERKKNKQK